MSNLFQTIKLVHPSLPGWCDECKAEALAALVIALRPLVTVEIGIYGGSSFIPMALAHKEIGYGMAYGIDPWDARASIVNETPENIEWWSKQDYGKLYSDFMTHIRELGLENCVTILRQTSNAVTPPNTIDLFHCDGNHTQQAIMDVQRFGTRVRIGGICVMDDLNWVSGQVKLAEQRLLQFGFVKLYNLGTGAVFQRVK